MKSFIRSVGAYVPEKRLSNDELAGIVDTSDEWIFSHTGIHNRHIAADTQSASDMAYLAARSALDAAEMVSTDIDLILVATSTPDFLGFPSTASIVQGKLEAGDAGAMDLFAACTGFIYGLETARAFIESGSARNVLVIGTEVLSRILDWKDRNSCVLFGDGAGAVVVSENSDEPGSRIEHSLLKAQGSGAGYLFVSGGGCGRPIGADEPERPYIHMNGRKVYNFAVKALCDIVRHLLDVNGTAIDEIAYIVPHQANIRIIEAAGKRMGLPPEKFYTNMSEYANTSAASIPLALHEMSSKGLLGRGDLILTIGFGGGLTFGGNLIHW